MGNRVAQLKGQSAESPRDKRRSGSWGGNSNKSSSSSSPFVVSKSLEDSPSLKRDKKHKFRASVKIHKSFLKYVGEYILASRLSFSSIN